MRQGTLIGSIIVAIGLVVAAISFALVGALLDRAEGDTELRLGRAEAEVERLGEEVARLSEDVREARAEIARLLEDIALRGGVAPAAPAAPAAPLPQLLLDPGEEVEGAPATEEMTEVMNLARARFNTGLTQPGNRAMLEVLGRPRETFSTDCEAVTEPRLAALLETREVGPIRVTMVRPALDSLERIMTRLRESEPDIYAAVGTAGALCARLIRGSASSISNHSWGTAIDLTLEDRLDGFADGGTQFGLLLLAELFNEEGWYWGATYNREDSMHFEVSEELLRRWASEGQL